MKKLKNMREADDMDFTPEEMAIINSEDDMEDGYFDIGEEDDVWADDYVGEDDDIEKTDLADSPDDEEFDDFDDDEEFDIEDPGYWADAKEINPETAWDDTFDDIRGDTQTGFYDNFNDHDAGEAGAYGVERFMAAKEKAMGYTPADISRHVDEDWTGYSRDYVEPIHHDETPADFKIDEELLESKNYSRKRVRESDIMSIVDMMNNDDAIRARLGRGPFYKAEEVTPEMVEMAAAKVGKSPNSIRNFLKAYLDPDYEGPVSMGESKRAYGKRMNEDTSAFMVSPKAADENREIPEWVIKKFGIREGRKYWANKQAKLKEAKGFTGYNSHAHGTLILTPRATEVAEIWQDALDMYDAGKLQGKNEFINYIIKERNGEEAYSNYMPWITTLTHRSGRPWGEDELIEIENNNNGFLW